MPVLILLFSSKSLLSSISEYMATHYKIEVLEDDHKTVRSHLSNMNSDTLYILTNCDLKPHRYEIYCLTKKNETSYLIVSSEELTTSKHDNPCIVNKSDTFDMEEITRQFKTLSRSTAHKKKIVGGNYLMEVKKKIQEINKENTSGILNTGIIQKECEERLLRMIQINPVDIESIGECYKKMIKSEEEGRGIHQ